MEPTTPKFDAIEPSDSTKELQKKPNAVLQILLTVVLVTLIGLGGYLAGKMGSKAEQRPTQTQTAQASPTIYPTNSPLVATPRPSATPTTVATTSGMITLPFENLSTILTKNCQGGLEHGYYMSIKDFSLISDVLIDAFNPYNSLRCFTGSEPSKGWITFGNTVDLFGPNTDELGHGGAPYLAPFGQIIRDKNFVKTYVHLDPPHACGYGIDSLTLMARVIKTMKTQDGSEVNFITRRTIAPISDSRLVALFNADVSTNNSDCNAVINLSQTEIDARVANFVRTLPSTDPIKLNIAQMEREIESIVLRR